jgi:hypothetical protein
MLRTTCLVIAVLGLGLTSDAGATVVKPATEDPKHADVKKADSLDVQDRLTDQDPFDRLRKGSRSKVYPVKMDTNKAYTIDLASDDFDAYLRVEDADGNALDEDDDGGDGLNARLTFMPPKGGTYKIIATTFNANETGAFTLKVRAASVLFAARGQLNNKDPFDRMRQTSYHKVHSLKMVPGRTYTIDLRSSDFDAYLRLEDSKQVNLAEDDDGGEGLNARVVFTPTQADTYRIIVTTCNGNETGNYTLTVAEKKD